MTKYYYNDELIRTSKAHSNYTHAVISERNGKIEVLACRSSKENAEKELNAIYNYNYGSQIKFKEDKINAMKNGKRYIFANEGRRTFKVEIKETDTIENETKELEQLKEDAKRFIEQTSVVELEIR